MAAMFPRVLLIHGFLSGPAAWDRLRRQAACFADTSAPPVPGFGASKTPSRMTIEELAEGLLPEVARFGPDYVVGHSMGALVALELARQVPGRFRTVGLAGLPLFENRADGQAFLHPRGRLHRTLLRNDRIAHVGCRALHHGRWGWAPLLPWLAPGVPMAHAHGAFHHSRDGHGRVLDDVVFIGAGRIPATLESERITLLHGGADRVAPLDRARSLAEERGWPFQVAPGAGHQVMVTRPRYTARWLRSRVLGEGSA